MKKTLHFVAALVVLMSSVTVLRADTTTTPAANAAKPAESKWAKNHPARHKINKKEKAQVKHTKADVKNGTLTKAQGNKLTHEDHQVRQEERDMASQNGGHLTKQEASTLKSQEQGIGEQRAADIKADAAAK